MEIYADVLFMINFCMDFICLYITAKICRASARALRLVAASALGGLYSVFACGFEGIAAVAGALSSSVIICLTAMKHKNVPNLLARTAAFFGVSLLLGGVCYCLFTGAGRSSYYNGTFYADVDALPLVLTGAAAGVFTLFYVRKTRTKMTVRSAEIKIVLNGKETSFSSLVDTGLLLCDPISADPVILIKRLSLQALTGSAPPESLPGFRLIPSDRGLIYSFRPSGLYIKSGSGEWKESCAIIGIDTSDGTFSDMDSLLPASLI